MTTEPEPSTTARDLRRRISFGSVRKSGELLELSRKELVTLLLLDDTTLLKLHAHLSGPNARCKTCAELALEMGGDCRVDHVKAMLRLLHLLVPVRRNGNGHAIRDRAGRFVAEFDMGEAPPDKAAMIRRWVATGISPEQAKKWADDMGASEGLT